MKRRLSIESLQLEMTGDSVRPRTIPRLTGKDKALVAAVQRGARYRFDGTAFARVPHADGAPDGHDGPSGAHPLQILRLVRMGRLALWRDTRGDYPELLVTHTTGNGT